MATSIYSRSRVHAALEAEDPYARRSSRDQIAGSSRARPAVVVDDLDKKLTLVAVIRVRDAGGDAQRVMNLLQDRRGAAAISGGDTQRDGGAARGMRRWETIQDGRFYPPSTPARLGGPGAAVVR